MYLLPTGKSSHAYGQNGLIGRHKSSEGDQVNEMHFARLNIVARLSILFNFHTNYNILTKKLVRKTTNDSHVLLFYLF